MAKVSQFEATEQQKNDIPKDGSTCPVLGDSKVQVVKDENVTGTRDAFESQQNEEWSHLISIAKCFPEIKNNERMGDIEFEAEDEEKDLPKRQSTNQTKVEDRPNPGKVEGDITGLSSRWIPTQWEQILKPQRMKQLIFTFKLKKIYSWILLICSLLPGAGAESTFEVEKVAMNITITAGMSLSVTYPVPRLPTGAHFSIIRESGDQELNCSKTLIFEADNLKCILGPENEGPCQALILYHLGSKDFLQLEGTVMEPGTYKYCIIQQVPENFALYEFMVVREPDPTVPSIFQNVTAVTELPITPTCPALDTDPLATQTGCDADSQGRVAPGSVCIFSCPSGYEGKGDVHKMCSYSGTWTTTNFTCQGSNTGVNRWKVATIILGTLIGIFFCIAIYIAIYRKWACFCSRANPMNFFGKSRERTEYQLAGQLACITVEPDARRDGEAGRKPSADSGTALGGPSSSGSLA